MRIGIGFDIHRLIPTLEKERVRLGGVDLPCYFRVQAHSDGDVLLHALTDALLGALALGDIGQHFPDQDPQNRGRSSADFVHEAVAEVRRLGWAIANVDANVLAEEPKMAAYAYPIRERIAHLLGIELSAVSLKAKTMEGLGAIGERKAIAAQVIVLLQESR